MCAGTAVIMVLRKCICEVVEMEDSVHDERAVAVREVLVYVCWAGYLECGENGVLTYQGGSRDYGLAKI